jgi:hypothetical protein
VRRVGYSTILMGGVRDPYILAQIDSWLAQLDDNVKTRIRNTVRCRCHGASPVARILADAAQIRNSRRPQRHFERGE